MHIISNLGLGGAEKLTATIVEHLDHTQFSASVCCIKETGYYGNRIIENGIEVYELGFSKALSVRGAVNAVCSVLKLRTILVQNHIDIVHTHVFGVGVVGRIAARLAGVPFIVHTTHRLNLYGPAETWLERILAWITTSYVVDSNAVRQAITSAYKIDQSKVRVIYNGIDPAAFGDLVPRQMAREKLGLPQDKKIISIIAHMTERKAQHIYIRAFAQVIQQHPETCLVLVGDGATRGSLEQLTQQLGLTEHVRFMGYREDLATFLAATDILAHPSEWEGFGIILAEAMYCKIPVITTNAGGGAEVVSHLETGILVPVGDIAGFAEATLTLLHDEALCDQYGNAGRQRVEALFLQREMVTQYELYYRELASR